MYMVRYPTLRCRAVYPKSPTVGFMTPPNAVFGAAQTVPVTSRDIVLVVLRLPMLNHPIDAATCGSHLPFPSTSNLSPSGRRPWWSPPRRCT